MDGARGELRDPARPNDPPQEVDAELLDYRFAGFALPPAEGYLEYQFPNDPSYENQVEGFITGSFCLNS